MKGISTVALLAAAVFARARATAADEFDAAALDDIAGVGSDPPAIGSNVDGGSVFTNYINLRRDGQFFLLWDALLQYEKPPTLPIQLSVILWCSSIAFTDIKESDSAVGYTARCLWASFEDLGEVSAAGAQYTGQTLVLDGFINTYLLSAVFVPQTNTFEGQFHKNTDDSNVIFFDDGRPRMSSFGWEGMDEGDPNPNSPTSSVSFANRLSWISVDEAASLLGTDVSQFTPDSHDVTYKEAWSAESPAQAATLQEGDEGATQDSNNSEEDGVDGQEEVSTDTVAGDSAEADNDQGEQAETIDNAGGDASSDTDATMGEDEDQDVDLISSANVRCISVAITGIFFSLLGSL